MQVTMREDSFAEIQAEYDGPGKKDRMHLTASKLIAILWRQQSIPWKQEAWNRTHAWAHKSSPLRLEWTLPHNGVNAHHL